MNQSLSVLGHLQRKVYKMTLSLSVLSHHLQKGGTAENKTRGPETRLFSAGLGPGPGPGIDLDQDPGIGDREPGLFSAVKGGGGPDKVEALSGSPWRTLLRSVHIVTLLSLSFGECARSF